MADQYANMFPLPPGGEDQDDHWNQYKEDDGAPVDRAAMLDVQQQMQQVLTAQNAMMAMLQQQMAQAQAQAQPRQPEYRQQEGAPLVPPVPSQEGLERLPEPLSLGCDDEEDDKKVTAKMYSIYWLKVEG